MHKTCYVPCCALQGSTIVYFGNDVCETIEYFSNDEKIVCLTPPHAVSDNVPVS